MLSYRQKIINEVRQGINRRPFTGLTVEDVASIVEEVKDFIDPFIVNVRKGAYSVAYVEFHERYLRKKSNGDSGERGSQLAFYYKIVLDEDGNRLIDKIEPDLNE
jgi:hypothetical protein